MSRFFIALLTAPLCVPLLAGAHDILLTFQHRDHPEIQYLTVPSMTFYAVVSYGGTFLLGIPLLSFLRLLGLSGLRVAGVVGFFVGALLWYATVGLYVVGHGGIDISHLTNLADIAWLTRFVAVQGLSNELWRCGALGVAVGITFWLIARPDRSRDRTSANNITRAQTGA